MSAFCSSDKSPDTSNVKRRGLFWLVVLEISVHGQRALKQTHYGKETCSLCGCQDAPWRMRGRGRRWGRGVLSKVISPVTSLPQLVLTSYIPFNYELANRLIHQQSQLIPSPLWAPSLNTAVLGMKPSTHESLKWGISYLNHNTEHFCNHPHISSSSGPNKAAPAPTMTSASQPVEGEWKGSLCPLLHRQFSAHKLLPRTLLLSFHC